MVHIPYKSSGQVRADLLGGQVEIGCLGISSVINNHKAGQLRIIAVTSAKRSPELPDIPSIGETVPGYDAQLWIGLLMPRAAPAAAVNRIHQEVTKLLQQTEVKTAFDRVGTYVEATNPADFSALLKLEFAKWGKVVRDIKLQVN
jgi:tripartite-type tricarboxylate transporter receptor subunit TctC